MLIRKQIDLLTHFNSALSLIFSDVRLYRRIDGLVCVCSKKFESV